MKTRTDLSFVPNLPQKLPDVLQQLGLVVGLETTLKAVPGSLHWHLRKPNETGILELTWDPINHEAWLEVRSNRLGSGWVADAAHQLVISLSG